MSDFSHFCKSVPCYVSRMWFAAGRTTIGQGIALSLFRKVCYSYCLLHVPKRQANLIQEHGVPDWMITLYIDHTLKSVLI